jgi:hypothetical protein
MECCYPCKSNTPNTSNRLNSDYLFFLFKSIFFLIFKRLVQQYHMFGTQQHTLLIEIKQLLLVQDVLGIESKTIFIHHMAVTININTLFKALFSCFLIADSVRSAWNHIPHPNSQPPPSNYPPSNYPPPSQGNYHPPPQGGYAPPPSSNYPPSSSNYPPPSSNYPPPSSSNYPPPPPSSYPPSGGQGGAGANVLSRLFGGGR